MAATRYKVTDPLAPRKAVDEDIGQLAEQLRGQVAERTPVATGRLRAGWRVERGHNHAVRLLVNDVPYARYVEYGTSDRPADPALGQTLAGYRGRS